MCFRIHQFCYERVSIRDQRFATSLHYNTLDLTPSLLSIRASDKCQREKRKTINGDDLLWAMSTLGFEEYVEPLKLFLSKYREVSPILDHFHCANAKISW